MQDLSTERRVGLAVNAVRSNPHFSVRRAAKFYDVPATTIQRRVAVDSDGRGRRCYRPIRTWPRFDRIFAPEG